MSRVNPNLVIIGVLAAGGVYLAWKGSKAAGEAVKAADKAVATGVGAVGSIFGLPTPDQTISDPHAVRRIIDSEGYLAASMKGTATAFFAALQLPSATSQVNQSTRTVSPEGGSFSDGASGGYFGAVDVFDPRYYGYQGNVVLDAKTGPDLYGTNYFAKNSTINLTGA